MRQFSSRIYANISLVYVRTLHTIASTYISY
jgi:hypothetical protein